LAWSTAGAEGIALLGRTSSTLESTAADLKVPTLILTGDITKDEDVKAAYEKIIQKFGHIDVVINSTGGLVAGLTGEVDSTAWWGAWVSFLLFMKFLINEL
jgi:NAD(P)-dependent dehydrogenase (short-subunit alcohol dehydrogenase family)